jgi:histidine triad (HIT) family protein
VGREFRKLFKKRISVSLMVKDCVFCKISRGEIPSKKIYENDNFFSIFDANPLTEKHCLVISKRHFVNALDLPSTLGLEFLDCVKKTVGKLLADFDGFNLVVNNFESAGQIVRHFHAHILPRRSGDGKSLDLIRRG